jgi:hypothetical protein
MDWDVTLGTFAVIILKTPPDGLLLDRTFREAITDYPISDEKKHLKYEILEGNQVRVSLSGLPSSLRDDLEFIAFLISTTERVFSVLNNQEDAAKFRINRILRTEKIYPALEISVDPEIDIRRLELLFKLMRDGSNLDGKKSMVDFYISRKLKEEDKKFRTVKLINRSRPGQYGNISKFIDSAAKVISNML